MKIVEHVLWLCGALLLALSISALGWGEFASQRSLATFHESQQVMPRPAPQLSTGNDAALRGLIELTFQTCSRTQLIVPLTVKLVGMQR
jgi:hypothetical protein